MSNETSVYDDDNYDDDYYDDDVDTKKSSSENKSISSTKIPFTTKTPASFIFNLFGKISHKYSKFIWIKFFFSSVLTDIPERSNHVVEPTCPKACLCLEAYKFIQCSNAGLRQIPPDIPTTAAIIDLSHNQIKEIKKTDFAHRTKLQEINLNYNFIEKLDKEVFIANFNN